MAPSHVAPRPSARTSLRSSSPTRPGRDLGKSPDTPPPFAVTRPRMRLTQQIKGDRTRPDFVLNGFLSVGFQTDQKFSGKYGEFNGVLGLAASHVFCPLGGCFVLSSTYNIWHYMAASEMCGACGPKYAAMGRVFVGLCLMYKLLLTSSCFSS